MISDLVDYHLRGTPQKGRLSNNTTASPKSSNDSSFENKAKFLQIPRPLLTQEEKFEAAFHAFEFKLIVPEQESLSNFDQLSYELDYDFQKGLYYNEFKSLEIQESEILNDERTTLMLKNVPKHLTPQDLKNLLNKDYKAQFDFLYLPYDNQILSNMGYAFVNFSRSEWVKKFYNQYNNRRWNQCDKQICQLKYAKLQGRRDIMNQIE